MSRQKEILQFWFGEFVETPEYQKTRGALWFGAAPAIDQEIRARFESDVNLAADGKLDDWQSTPLGTLALLLLLDQFSLNIYRGGKKGYELSEKSLPYALRAIDRGDTNALHPLQKMFFYLPLEHAEEISLQEKAVLLFRRELDSTLSPFLRHWLQGSYDWAVLHRDIVARFGRFPHRNAALGRTSTPEEIEYLAQGKSPF